MEIPGLFLNSPELSVKMDFSPETDVLGFCCVLLLGN